MFVKIWGSLYVYGLGLYVYIHGLHLLPPPPPPPPGIFNNSVYICYTIPQLLTGERHYHDYCWYTCTQ